ncbi:MAG: hypothetical protein KJO38_06515 [Gammaproteobacteria bacterium]|nr:hypothetical protein [Gammaproteobacteria bacterium]
MRALAASLSAIALATALTPGPLLAAFDGTNYDRLVGYLNEQGLTVEAGEPLSIDGTIVFPKGFRDAFEAFLGDGFEGNEVRVGQGGRLIFKLDNTGARDSIVARFDCRYPGFTYRWREGADEKPYSQVVVLTRHPACIKRNESDAGELSWYVPKGRHKDIARSLMLFREVFVQP